MVEPFDFLLTEFTANSVSAALGHSDTYKDKESWGKLTEPFHEYLQSLSRKLIKKYPPDGLKPLNSSDVYSEIDNLISHFNSNPKFSEHMKESKLRVGVAQKMVNLQLKYLWSAGKIVTPPLFPIDRGIIEKIIRLEKNRKSKKELQAIPCWTQIDKQSDLKLLYDSLSRHLTSNQDSRTPAQWELDEWVKYPSQNTPTNEEP